jgi:hypothetical protein
MRKALIAIAALTLVGACTSPVLKGDSVETPKRVSFPEIGVPSTATVGSLAALYSNYQSQQVYRLTEPFKTFSLLVGTVAVSPEDRLFVSDLKGETAYCTEGKALNTNDFTTGKVCFKSATPGKFHIVTYPSGATWQSKPISPEIDFTSHESAGASQAGPLKRELIFDGAQGNALTFSERIYERSLETPARVKPLMASVSSLPAKITLDGLELNVIRYDARTVTFEVIHPWQ